MLRPMAKPLQQQQRKLKSLLKQKSKQNKLMKRLLSGKQLKPLNLCGSKVLFPKMI
jgi:hypothetical protein